MEPATYGPEVVCVDFMPRWAAFGIDLWRDRVDSRMFVFDSYKLRPSSPIATFASDTNLNELTKAVFGRAQSKPILMPLDLIHRGSVKI